MEFAREVSRSAIPIQEVITFYGTWVVLAISVPVIASGNQTSNSKLDNDNMHKCRGGGGQNKRNDLRVLKNKRRVN